MAPLRVAFGALQSAIGTALELLDVPPEPSRRVAEALATTDAWGVSTHGVKNLVRYMKRVRAGGINPLASPAVVAEGPSWATVDGDNGLGQVCGAVAMDLATAKARECGIGYVGVRHTCHFGAAGYYAWLAASRGLIGLAVANDIPSVAAPGSRRAVMGSNPFAYAVPAGRHRPLLFDIATATVAGGKVYAARDRGEEIPDTWLLDAEGRPTTDPSGFPEVGSLQPAAGHKGYGLAVLVELLAGVATGAATTWKVGNWMWGEDSAPTNHGAGFIAIDATSIVGNFEARVEEFVDEVHGSPTADGVDRILVPGEPEWLRYDESMERGVLLPDDVAASLGEAMKFVGMDPDSLVATSSDRKEVDHE